MRSIRGRFALLTLACTVLIAAIMGYLSMSYINSQAEHDANTIMNLACAYEAAQIDTVLEGVEDATTIEADAVERMLASRPAGSGALTPAELMAMEGSLQGTAESTAGTVLFYLRVEGQGQDAVSQGFAYARSSERYKFSDIGFSGQVPGEVDVVDGSGWDEERLRRGESLWLEPIDNDHMTLLVAIYVRPLFVNGEYVGVVGMGVDFQIVIDQVAAISSFETGYGYLTDAVGNVMYHPTIPYGTNLSDDDEEVPEVDQAIAEGTTEQIVSYTYNGANKRMAFHLLQNDMRLVLSVEASEIYAQRDQLTRSLLGVTLFAAVGFAFVAFYLGRRALAPLNDLTAAAQRVADGDLDVEILSSNTEEVSNLIDAYQRTVANLREQLAIIDGLAHRDGLTGAFNKSAYNERQEQLDELIAEGAGGDVAFAVVMFDVNDLKLINDSYGHEAGDEYLRNAVARIMASFADCTVYRIGGDEFVVLMEGAQVAELDAGIELIEKAIRDSQDATDPWNRTSLAYGVGIYEPRIDESVAMVFGRADSAMYEHKQRMKVGRTPDASA